MLLVKLKGCLHDLPQPMVGFAAETSTCFSGVALCTGGTHVVRPPGQQPHPRPAPLPSAPCIDPSAPVYIQAPLYKSVQLRCAIPQDATYSTESASVVHKLLTFNRLMFSGKQPDKAEKDNPAKIRMPNNRLLKKLLFGEVKGLLPPGRPRSTFSDVALCNCQNGRTSRPYRDAQDRLLWRDKPCPART